jgi:hypothetical protein
MFCYDTTEVAGNKNFKAVNFNTMDASAIYLKHYENYKYLEFLVKNETDRFLKNQAQKEFDIAVRKMDFWEKKPLFSLKTVIEGKKAIDLKWSDTK